MLLPGTNSRKWLALVTMLIGLLISVGPAFSQPKGAIPPDRESAIAASKFDQEAPGQSLSEQTTDPTASLMSLSLQNWFTASFHRLSNQDANTIVFRPVIPFRTGDLSHILRVTLPYVSHSPAGPGLSDTAIFDLLVFNASWGRWGIGPLLLLPTATKNSLGSEKWSAGPAVGAVAPWGKWQFGLFVQTAFSFAGASNRQDVQFMSIQPIIAYQLSQGWALSAGSASFDYDFEIRRWVSLTPAVQLGKVFQFGGFFWKAFGEVNYNFKDDPGLPQWGLKFGLNLLLPTGGKK